MRIEDGNKLVGIERIPQAEEETAEIPEEQA